MEVKKDGGSAFPRNRTDPFGRPTTAAHGMTLRDYFAAQMLPALASGESIRACLFSAAENKVDPRAVAAKLAYAYADAMLAERAE